MEYAKRFKSMSRERAIAIGTFIVGAILFGGLSVFATDVGTNVTVTGSVFATSSLDVTSNATVHGGLAVRAGVGAATTSPGGLEADHAHISKIQVGTGSAINKIQWGTCSVNPPMLKPGNASTTACTANTVSTSDKVFVTPPGLPWSNSTDASTGNIVFVAASTTAASTITIQVGNTSTSTALDAPASTWTWMAIQ